MKGDEWKKCGGGRPWMFALRGDSGEGVVGRYLQSRRGADIKGRDVASIVEESSRERWPCLR